MKRWMQVQKTGLAAFISFAPLYSAIRFLLLVELLHQRPLALIGGSHHIENCSNDMSVLTIFSGME
jgi:hypothetical protein